MKIKFRDIKMSKGNKERLGLINDIIEEYQNDGYVLTLRQLYYQLVSRDIIPNKQTEYTKLSILLKEGRMAGIVDWEAIEDRLRRPSKPSAFDSPAEKLDAAIFQYAKPRQRGQTTYVEVWVEKDALSGVLKRVTERYHIPILVNRGYSSASAMFDAYQRFEREYYMDKNIKILYLGDYDPSGIDMIRDVEDRTMEFFQGAAQDVDFEVISIALTKEQIIQYNPPPNPAKMTDPRAKDFVREHGSTSWEVDALRPDVLNKILEDAIQSYIDLDLYNKILEEEGNEREKLKELIQYL